MSDERLIDIVDNDWRNDKLPNEDIQLPLDKLPDPEDSENQTMKEVVSICFCNHSSFLSHSLVCFLSGRQVAGSRHYESTLDRGYIER
jgi:hypothetical protein